MKYSQPILPFSRTFADNPQLCVSERLTMALRAAVPYLPISFPENCMLPTIGIKAHTDMFGFWYGRGIHYDEDTYRSLLSEYPDAVNEIEAVKKEVMPYTFSSLYECASSPANLRLVKAHACWGGAWGGHANISFGKLVRLGTDGLREQIKICQSKNPDKASFYRASFEMAEILDLLGERIKKIAAKKIEEKAPHLDEWVRIERAFAWIPRHPARDFYEAVMAYWMLFTFDGVDSPGRFDQEMYDYYCKSPRDEQLELLRRFLEAMHNVRGWNLCLSGSDEYGKDETNPLTYDILQMVTDMKYQTPNLTLRVHPGTPAKLWDMAIDCIATGIGLPALYNDSVVCKALEKIGIPPRDSHDYCMNGCNQIDIMGKSHMGLEDGEVNFAKVLELTLHGGYDNMSDSHDLLALPLGSPCSATSFDAFLTLFFRQLDFITDCSIALSNGAQEAYARFAPNPLRSLFVEGCLEKGRDYKDGGPLYGHGQILAEGLSDTTDSLYAIKKLVYEDEAYTMEELVKALDNDFKGYDKLYRDFKSCPKFGNDLPTVDMLAASITDHFFAYLKEHRTYRGGMFTGGCSPFNRAAVNGQAVAALPNGKHRGESTFADSIAAVPGCDTHGPTAALKSVMCYHQDEACSGFVTQMKFDRSLFSSKDGKEAFLRLAKTYFANGGQQLAVNVLDRNTLLDARKHPEKYKNLIVRVGGYSDYFTALSPELQQNIIDRASFMLS